MENGILHKTKRFTIWIDGSDLTFEYNSNGEQFTLYCELKINTITDLIDNVVVYDYDGCFDFNREHVVFSAKIETATLRRLTTLLIETKYDNGNLYLDFDERLEIRRISSILASELWLYYKSRKSSTPGVVEKWRESCLTPDEFSEIRNAWEDCESI